MLNGHELFKLRTMNIVMKPSRTRTEIDKPRLILNTCTYDICRTSRGEMIILLVLVVIIGVPRVVDWPDRKRYACRPLRRNYFDHRGTLPE